ncbi:MAG: tyrosine-protein phosphatase [Bacteroidales bacterium]|jgi:protein-tyrosine phosphatase|nr:tyrosine-protein phosphatase [Bacteroidales bacterium]
MLEGVINARDLGGIRIGGKTVKPGLLLRTGHLNEVSDESVRHLSQDLHLKKIFDFRTLQEAAFQPDREIPGAEHILLPTLDVEAEKASGEAVPQETFLNLPAHIVQLSFTRLFQQKARQLYPSLVLSEFSQLQYATFLNLILETEEGSVLWHCSQGKDRTGIGAALILGALGADTETIVEDFDRSNEVYRPVVDKLCAQVVEAGGGEKEMDVVRAFMGVSVKNFRYALKLIDANWGSIPGYLEEAMGIMDDDLAVLRARYLQD